MWSRVLGLTRATPSELKRNVSVQDSRLWGFTVVCVTGCAGNRLSTNRWDVTLSNDSRSWRIETRRLWDRLVETVQCLISVLVVLLLNEFWWFCSLTNRFGGANFAKKDTSMDRLWSLLRFTFHRSIRTETHTSRKERMCPMESTSEILRAVELFRHDCDPVHTPTTDIVRRTNTSNLLPDGTYWTVYVRVDGPGSPRYLGCIIPFFR